MTSVGLIGAGSAGHAPGHAGSAGHAPCGSDFRASIACSGASCSIRGSVIGARRTDGEQNRWNADKCWAHRCGVSRTAEAGMRRRACGDAYRSRCCRPGQEAMERRFEEPHAEGHAGGRVPVRPRPRDKTHDMQCVLPSLNRDRDECGREHPGCGGPSRRPSSAVPHRGGEGEWLARGVQRRQERLPHAVTARGL